MTVHVDAEVVRRTLDDGRVEQIRWDDIGEIRLVTTSEGPFVDDVFFLLTGRDGRGCAVPQSAVDEDVLARLQAFPGFDNEALIEAMTEVGDRSFLLWRRGW